MYRFLKAGQSDIEGLLPLINSAYRGESSRQGWTTEADIIEGDQRIGAAELEAALAVPGSVLLKCLNNEGQLLGSVYLEPEADGLCLGMLSVWPHLQNQGIGRRLIEAAENWARERGILRIYMHVISVRNELIAWYERLGYRRTGKTLPFDDFRFGVPRIDFVFEVLKKDLSV